MKNGNISFRYKQDSNLKEFVKLMTDPNHHRKVFDFVKMPPPKYLQLVIRKISQCNGSDTALQTFERLLTEIEI